ncbi:MAG: hypothetical protein K2X37_11090 [Chitinophagaceae bacterium]|nr:hypothetical protein [Chitinophagaceae bacterium]
MKYFLIFLFLIITIALSGQARYKQAPMDFLPNGYVVYQKITGDLNKDGIADCVLLIKGTDSNKIVIDEHRGRLDQNRKGIIVLFKRHLGYELVVKNKSCFSAEDAYEGGYIAPEYNVEIKEGNLHIDFGQGRNGFWQYIFRFQNTDFYLIGYDARYPSSFQSEYISINETSINFLSRKKLKKEVIGIRADGKERYKATWTNIKIKKPIKLTDIIDFDDFSIQEIFGI